MFFFIAGIQPKTIVIDSSPRQCPSCGLNQAWMKRQDHYLSLFFLPVFRVKKGLPFLECGGCGNLFPESEESLETRGSPDFQCPICHLPVEPTYRFCPHCGKSVS